MRPRRATRPRSAPSRRRRAKHPVLDELADREAVVASVAHAREDTRPRVCGQCLSMQRIPARIGDPLDAVETPALVVDLDAFEHNLDLMANAVRGSAARAARPTRSRTSARTSPRRRSRAARWASAARRSTRRRPSSRRASPTSWSPTRSSCRRRSRASPHSRSRRPSACWSTTRGECGPLGSGRARAARSHVYVEIDVGARALRRRAGPSRGALAQAAAATGLALPGLHAYHGARSTCARPTSGARPSRGRALLAAVTNGG